jgi:hypothetical protein
MLKRIFWLALIATAGWIIWLRLRQRQEEFAASLPQFGPPQPFAKPAPLTAPPPRPEPATVSDVASTDPDAKLDTAPSMTSETDKPGQAISLDAPEAPPGIDEAPETSSAHVAVPEDTRALDEAVAGYCVRCKTKRTIKDAHEEITESGRRAARGTCPVCGANMFTFLATNDEVSATNDEANEG